MSGRPCPRAGGDPAHGLAAVVRLPAAGALLAFAQYRGWRLDWLPRLAVPAAALCVAGLALPAFGHGGAGKLAAMPAHELMNFVFAAAVYQAT